MVFIMYPWKVWFAYAGLRVMKRAMVRGDNKERAIARFLELVDAHNVYIFNVHKDRKMMKRLGE
jgi:hypothetical protein